MIGGIVFSCQGQHTGKADQKETVFAKNPVQYVNPFIGTAPLTDPIQIGYTPPEGWRVWAGLTFPGSALPNAMVQVSPITEYGSGAGYEYEDTEILGFTHTNKGHWNLCNIPILPLSGDAKRPFKSKFSHENEKASPAYYEVFLEDYGVKTRLTSTLRAAIHEYTFEKNSNRKILFDLGRANNEVRSWKIEKVGENSISGYQDMGRDKIHFFAILNTPISSMEKVDEGKAEGHAIIGISDTDGPVILKIGLSFVSAANAKENMVEEVGEKSFEDVHTAGSKLWNGFLSKVEIAGGTQKQKTLFYSSLYRSFLWPALRSDVNSEFTDTKGNVRKEDFKYYTIPSLWDTYRNKLVLLQVLQPEVTTDVIKSLMDIGELTGFVPTFFHGDHGSAFIAGAYARGIRDFDVNKAYSLLLNNAYKEMPDGRSARPYIKEYIQKGFISDPDIKNPHVETKAAAGVSKTLEYAYDDYALAQLAKAMKDELKYKDLMERSQNYKNVFDKKTHFMRGRLENGDWITPFDPQYPYYEYMYREANAWQVSFYVPHDMPGLVDLYGPEKFEEKLDSLFTLPWNPEHIARNISSFKGQYCQGNQPDHEAPFSYYFVNKPEKSQAVIDDLLENYYGMGDDGIALPGMDDAGEMSAWYVCAASGLYPLSPADPEYLVSVPIFDAVKWKLKKGKELLIQNTHGKRKMKRILVDGKEKDGYFVSHNLFNDGGKIETDTKE
ncbi:MAG TPA: glycoside hydrolase family 92 protein [Pricia antarctica]|uniref:Glycoside hydrolase family 92 protein n=2 Tax=root TaxID=1 RepID=A0A831QTT8_9FLAO|nr:glycoside hydrolase family 92 protein [Pricia antarctica]